MLISFTSLQVSSSQSSSLIKSTSITHAFIEHRSDVQVKGRGEVVTILKDDNTGSRHQKFILKLASGQTVLIAHNIDLAPRVASLEEGDFIEFYGEYEWNKKGGVVHWTHRDPKGNHIHGWLKHNGKTYQ
ncbi:DUF3465 domain-containing protein [Psychromonas sp. RZ22]|nr:DUF3465 domain-containing protein [Psychromonas sp. RZ22]